MNENEVNLNNLEMWNFINHSVNALFRYTFDHKTILRK